MADDKKQRTTATFLWQGAAVLGIAAVISKLIGTLQKIPLQNIGGDQAFGIYTLVFPFYTLILFMTTAGFPIAVSRFVSERAAAGDREGARKVLAVSTVLLSMTGVLGFVLLFLGAEQIAVWTGSVQTKEAIRSVSFALLVVPVLSAFRGYFQGMQNMIPTAVSQVVEQIVRVATMLVLLFMFTANHYSAAWIAAGAAFGSTAGGVAALLVMMVYWGKEHRTYRTQPLKLPFSDWLSLSGRMVKYAIPVCLGAIMVPLLGIVDTFTLPHLLRAGGLTESAALTEFGVYARGLSLVQFVALLFSSMSVALIPALTRDLQRGNYRSAVQQAQLALRAAWMVGLAASVGMAVAAQPINVMLYQTEAGTTAMGIVAFSILFTCVQIISASVLQGWGAVLLPALHLLIAAACKIGLNLWLIPRWGIEGAAISAVLTYGIVSVLHLAALQRIEGLDFSVKVIFGKPAVAVILMAAAVWGVIQGLDEFIRSLAWSVPHRLDATLKALAGTSVGFIVYGISLIGLKTVPVGELDRLPLIGKMMIAIVRLFRRDQV